MTASAANNSAAAAALVAALKESGESLPTPAPAPPSSASSSSHRRRLSVKKSLEPHSMGGAGSALGSSIARARAGSNVDQGFGRKLSPTNAIDGNSAGSAPVSTKNRSRRASEGSHLIRGEGKRVPVEIKCERCGKGYKHSSCLTKHMCVYPRCQPSRHPSVPRRVCSSTVFCMLHRSPSLGFPFPSFSSSEYSLPLSHITSY